MDYIVLARRWRPQQFDDIVGQDNVTTTLKNAISKNRIGHAYIFTGPRGIGKTTIARVFAKALNCERGPISTPCDKCTSCMEIINGNSLDVLEIDGASNRGIDEIRELRQNVKYAPTHGKYKVYIIDEVHQITIDAFNALLKTLEEPPAHVKFFFATTEPHKVPPTILSRCQRFDLRPISSMAISSRLKTICSKERVDIDDEALMMIARYAEGSMRDAESILDQAIVYSAGRINGEAISSILGLVNSEAIYELAEIVARGDPEAAIRLLNRIMVEGKDLPHFVSDLSNHFRNMLILKVADSSLLILPSDVISRLSHQTELFSREQLLYIIETLAELESGLRRSLSRKILLEIALLRLVESRHRVGIAEIVGKIEAIQNRLEGSALNPSGDDPAGERESGDIKLTIEEVRKRWQEVLDCVGKEKPLLKSYLIEGAPLEIEGDTLIVCFGEAFDFHRNGLENFSNRRFVESVLTRVLGTSLRIGFRVRKAERKSVEKKVKNDNQLCRDPMIQKAISMFNAEIVDIKK